MKQGSCFLLVLLVTEWLCGWEWELAEASCLCAPQIPCEWSPGVVQHLVCVGFTKVGQAFVEPWHYGLSPHKGNAWGLSSLQSRGQLVLHGWVPVGAAGGAHPRGKQSLGDLERPGGFLEMGRCSP